MHSLSTARPAMLAAATRRILAALRGTSAAASHGGGEGEPHRPRGGQMRRIAFANRWPVLVAPVPRGANANALAPVAV